MTWKLGYMSHCLAWHVTSTIWHIVALYCKKLQHQVAYLCKCERYYTPTYFESFQEVILLVYHILFYYIIYYIILYHIMFLTAIWHKFAMPKIGEIHKFYPNAFFCKNLGNFGWKVKVKEVHERWLEHEQIIFR